ncbi:hypothetical protein BGX27_003730 [Mortierella sp. AM989]|nr:hypothetical protein BGX27_003730 [Mortierella sp. AM989]
MAYTMSSSFTYAPDVVDFDAMNITETFPEASSFSFELSGSYNHSYSDSISGIPLAQQAIWDESIHHTVNSSRVFAHSSAMSSLNNSANNSMSSGQPPSRHLLMPPPQYGHHRLLAQHHSSLAQHHSSPLKGEYPYSENDDGSEDNASHRFDEYEESSLQNSWIDDTRDQNGIMLLNDKEHQDEQHLLFLQDIGASANLSHGDSISLFAKLADESNLSCDLFKEELGADETRDHSRLQEQFSGSLDNPLLRTSGLNNNGRAIENEIFDKEFMASLRTPLVQQPPPPLESSNRNILDGLHTISAPKFMDQDTPKQDGSEHRGGNEAYKHALKSFYDSLKVADPIKTPHKFAPQPLPILWNEPKIRSKGLPSFNLADYKDKAKAALAVKGTNPFVDAVVNSSKRDSHSSSPTTTHSVPNSSHSSPLSSAGASPPLDIKARISSTPKTPTASTYIGNSENLQHDRDIGTQQQKQVISPTSGRIRRPTVSNPHLAFDPTIAPSERVDETKSAKGTLERRSALQQAVRSKAHQDDQEDGDVEIFRRSMPPTVGAERQGSISGASVEATGGLRGSAVRKRRSLHQDLFLQEQSEDNGGNDGGEQQQRRQDQDIFDGEQQELDGSINRRGSRLLPESLTSVKNHAIHQETTNLERARRLSEEENAAASKISETLSLGRVAGARYSRSSSNGSGSAAQVSPTTPTTSNPYGTLTGRTPKQSIQRLSISGMNGIYTKPQDQDEAQNLGQSKLPSPPVTISRNGIRSSPPNAQQGVRRPGFASQEMDFQRAPRLHSPADYDDDDDFYHAERDDQQLPRAMHHQQNMDREVPEWQEEEEQQRRYQSPQQQSKFRDSPPLVRRTSSDLQKEQHNLQRLRIQQQAREEVYGRGYGNGYADDPEFIDEFQSRPNKQLGGVQQRAAQPSPTRDYFSSTTKSGNGVMRNSPPVQSQTRYSEHYRRQSRDGHSLLPASRVSPPLNGIPTTRAPSANSMNSIYNAGTSRRSLSDGRGSIVSSASSRRLSNAATVGSSGYGSALPTVGSYSTGNNGGMAPSTSLHGRSVSTGSALGNGQRTSLYAPSAGMSTAQAGGRGGFSIPDVNPSSIAPRRSMSNMIQPTSTIRRSSGGYGAGPTSAPASSGIRGSNFGAPAASPTLEYARVFVPPRQSVSNNGYGGASNNYSNGSNINSRSQNLNDHDMYSYKPEVPTRYSSLGSGNTNTLGHRSSIATLRNSGGNIGNGGSGMLSHSSSSSLMSSPPNIPSTSSSSHLRRASSMSVNAPNGPSSLGRNSGLMAHRQQQSQYQQPPMQQYQRTSIYGYN